MSKPPRVTACETCQKRIEISRPGPMPRWCDTHREEGRRAQWRERSKKAPAKTAAKTKREPKRTLPSLPPALPVGKVPSLAELRQAAELVTRFCDAMQAFVA